MNGKTKLTLSIVAAAVLGSTATLLALKSMDKIDYENSTETTETKASASADILIGQAEPNSNFLTVSQHSAVETDFTKAAESTINGVVSIKSYAVPKTTYSQNGMFNDPFFEFFFGQPMPQQQQRQPKEQKEQPLGLGSGVIISEDGYIVTNNHVIDGAERLEITLNDNRRFDAQVIGADPLTDLALIKIDATGLPVIPIGDSDALKVGEWVLAVGNPFGFTSTVTTGIVSAKARSITSAQNGRKMGIESYIQTDAAVNPGNSGGALVNLNGELIGINTAIYSQTGNYAGYSFAIPSAMVVKVMTDIKQYGTVQRAVLGVAYQELTPEIAKEHDITAVNDGLYVAEVTANGAAEKAGIKEGDVITAVDGHETHNSAQLMEALNRYRPGDKITVTFYRNNKPQTVNVTLLNNQGSTKIVQPVTVAALGAKFNKLTEETMKKLNLRYGVQVSDLTDGKLKNAGIKDGFIILDINNARVNSSDDVERIYNAIMEADDEYDRVMFITGVYPSGKKVYYAVDLAD